MPHTVVKEVTDIYNIKQLLAYGTITATTTAAATTTIIIK